MRKNIIKQLETLGFKKNNEVEYIKGEVTVYVPLSAIWFIGLKKWNEAQIMIPATRLEEYL